MNIRKNRSVGFSTLADVEAHRDVVYAALGPRVQDYHLFTTMTMGPDVRPKLKGMSRNRMTILIACYGKPDATALLWRLWKIANPNGDGR